LWSLGIYLLILVCCTKKNLATLLPISNESISKSLLWQTFITGLVGAELSSWPFRPSRSFQVSSGGKCFKIGIPNFFSAGINMVMINVIGHMNSLTANVA
jgi:hypothetical protein